MGDETPFSPMNSTVLITVDCLRPDHVHTYGYERKTTPNIDSLASEGAMYTDAYSNGPGTRWAFRAISMGVYPLRIDGAGLPGRGGTTLAEVLSEHGYRTAAFADNPFLTSHFNQDRGFDSFYGTDYWADEASIGDEILFQLNEAASNVSDALSDGPLYQGLKRVYDTFRSTVEAQSEQTLSSDRQIVEQARDWIELAEERDEPYFVWVHLMDAHHPYQYFPEHRETIGISDDSEHVRIPGNVVDAPEEPRQEILDTYDANLREADSHIGRLVKSISDDSTIVVTGDHGEEFGRHNPFHQASVYNSISRVPLIIRSPEIVSGQVTNAVSHIDIPATVAELAGVEEQPALWEGIPLDGLEPPERDIFLGIEKPGEIQGAVVRDDWKYHCTMSDLSSIDQESVYDIESDPNESRDVSATEETILGELRTAWKRHVKNVRSNRIESENELFDPNSDLSANELNSKGRTSTPSREVEKRLEDLGYK